MAPSTTVCTAHGIHDGSDTTATIAPEGSPAMMPNKILLSRVMNVSGSRMAFARGDGRRPCEIWGSSARCQTFSAGMPAERYKSLGEKGAGKRVERPETA
ncbi:hypothetical protein ACWC0C_43965 [Streptomyces sp. NPDC001709]